MYLLGEVEFGVETFVCVFLNMSSIRMLIFIIFKKLLNMIFYDFTCGGTSHQWEKICVQNISSTFVALKQQVVFY
jgi:hypothetical protein